MKRTTAVKRTKTHLKDYRKRLEKDRYAWLENYVNRTGTYCPLCAAVRGHCSKCIRWPKITPRSAFPCNIFRCCINGFKTVRVKLRWIDKFEAELDRWAAEEAAS